ncbi:MAG: hypothetical protein RSF73_07325 [Ruthenibacterium sp.]
MAYQIQRAQKVCETLELLDADGNIAAHISVNLDVDKTAMEFNKRYNAVIVAEKAVHDADIAALGETVRMTQEQADTANTAFTVFGTAILDLFAIVFGAENTQTLLAFFDGNYYEMSMQVVPFLMNVVLPSMKEHLQAQRIQMAENYKVAQRKT